VADLRTGCAYLFGAICPERQTGAAVVMQRADTQGMQHHLDEIQRQRRAGRPRRPRSGPRRWLSNHVFNDYDILDAVCDAWNRLSTSPPHRPNGSRISAVSGPS